MGARFFTKIGTIQEAEKPIGSIFKWFVFISVVQLLLGIIWWSSGKTLQVILYIFFSAAIMFSAYQFRTNKTVNAANLLIIVSSIYLIIAILTFNLFTLFVSLILILSSIDARLIAKQVAEINGECAGSLNEAALTSESQIKHE